VALINGDILTYCGKTLVDTLKTGEPCNGILFGIFGREEGCLVVNTSSGGLITKIIGRLAKLNVAG
jgi:Bardet-Biedl syndrome 1 protein